MQRNLAILNARLKESCRNMELHNKRLETYLNEVKITGKSQIISKMQPCIDKAKKSILIIDDDDIDLIIAKRMLQLKFDIDIVTKKDGKEAIEFLLSKKDDDRFPILIFVDIIMPFMNGLQFVDAFERYFKGDAYKNRIVMVSSSILRKERLDFLERDSISCFIEKPFLVDKLGSDILKLIQDERDRL